MKKFSFSFRLAIISQIISLLGGSVLQFGILLFILRLTGSGGAYGLAMAISTIPPVVFAIPGGVVADRKNKKKCIVGLDFTKTVISFILLIIFLSDAYSIPLLIAFITLFMSLVTLFNPILTASVPTIVDEDVLVEANGIIQSVNAVAHLLGVVLGGFLFATIGLTAIILICGVLFMISTVIDLFIKIPFAKNTGKSSVIQELKAGLHYMTKESPQTLKITSTFAILALLYIPIFMVVLPYVAVIHFDVGDTLFGVAQGFVALGMLIGGVASTKLKKWLKVEYFSKWILGMSVLCLPLALAVGPIFSGAVTFPFWLFNTTLLLIMIIVTFGNVLVMATVQENAPAHLLGKVVALVILSASFATPFGHLVFGRLVERLADDIYILFIVIAIITTGVAFVSRDMFRKVR